MPKGSLAGALRFGVTVGTMVVLVAVAAALGARELISRQKPETDRALLVFEYPDETGTKLAGVLLDVDLKEGTITSVDTSTAVRVPGTTFATVREAYVYGGAAAVGGAYAELTGGVAPGGIVVRAEDWPQLLGDEGDVSVELPGAVNVFTGEALAELAPGATKVRADNVFVLLMACSYLPEDVAESVRAAVTEATIAALKRDPDALARLERTVDLRGNMDETSRAAFCERAAASIAAATPSVLRVAP